MEIIKIFSEGSEETLYRVSMTDEELSLYSEFQKEYAKKDYEGLSKGGKKYLKEKRDELAKQLWEERSKNKKIDPKQFEKGRIKTMGGFEVDGVKGFYLHTNKDKLLEEIPDIKKKPMTKTQIKDGIQKSKKLIRDHNRSTLIDEQLEAAKKVKDGLRKNAEKIEKDLIEKTSDWVKKNPKKSKALAAAAVVTPGLVAAGAKTKKKLDEKKYKKKLENLKDSQTL